MVEFKTEKGNISSEFIGLCGKCCDTCEDKLTCVGCEEKECDVKICLNEREIENCTYCETIIDGEICDKLRKIDIKNVWEIYKRLHPKKIFELLFLFEIKEKRHKLISNKTYLENLYCEHNDEKSFNSCLAIPERNSIIIKGPLGSGKTTYLKRIIHKNKENRFFIYINMEEFAVNFNNVMSASKFLFEFDKMLKQNLVQSLIENIESTDRIFKEVTDLYFDEFNVFNEKKKYEHDVRIEAILIYKVLTTINSDSSKNIFDNFSYFRNKSKEQRKKKLKELDTDVISSIFELITLQDILFLFTEFFKPTYCSVFILCIDNLDSLEFNTLPSMILNEVSIKIRNIQSVFSNLAIMDRAWFLVLSLRDNNLSQLNNGNAFAKQLSIITLSDFPEENPDDEIKYLHDYRKGKNYKEIAEFSKKIIQMKKDFMIKECDINIDLCHNVYIQNFLTILTYCLNVLDKKSYFSGKNIFKLSNYSVRLFQKMIFDIVHEISMNYTEKQKLIKDSNDLKITKFMKDIGKSIFNRNSSYIIEQLSNDFDLLLNSKKCEINRMILTYLWNIKGVGCDLQTLRDILVEFFNYTDEIIKESLFTLIQTKREHSGLIYILQSKQIFSQEDIIISSASKAYIDFRGEVFVEKIMLDFDYFSYILLNNDLVRKIIIKENDVNIGKFLQLEDCSLSKATILIKYVYRFIEEINNIYHQLYDQMNKRFNKTHNAIRMEDLRSFLYKTKVYYINRIADSHQTSIRKYVINYSLKNNETIEKFSKQYKIDLSKANSKVMFLDHYFYNTAENREDFLTFINQIIANVEEQECNSLKTIKTIYKQYNDMKWLETGDKK